MQLVEKMMWCVTGLACEQTPLGLGVVFSVP